MRHKTFRWFMYRFPLRLKDQVTTLATATDVV